MYFLLTSSGHNIQLECGTSRTDKGCIFHWVYDNSYSRCVVVRALRRKARPQLGHSVDRNIFNSHTHHRWNIRFVGINHSSGFNGIGGRDDVPRVKFTVVGLDTRETTRASRIVRVWWWTGLIFLPSWKGCNAMYIFSTSRLVPF